MQIENKISSFFKAILEASKICIFLILFPFSMFSFKMPNDFKLKKKKKKCQVATKKLKLYTHTHPSVHNTVLSWITIFHTIKRKTLVVIIWNLSKKRITYKKTELSSTFCAVWQNYFLLDIITWFLNFYGIRAEENKVIWMSVFFFDWFLLCLGWLFCNI